MADEEIVIEVSYDVDEAEKSIDGLSNSIVGLEEKNKSLRADMKKTDAELAKEGKTRSELSTQVAKNSASLKDAKKERNELLKVQKLQANSLDALKQKNKELIQQRNKVNLNTKDGQKQFKELNKQIKANNETLSKAEQQGGNFGRSVGNYTQGIKDAIPGVGSLTTSVSSLFKLFLTNPIGLIVAAFASLISYLKGTEEGQKKLNVIMKVFDVALGNLMDVVIKVGEYLFSLFENPKESLQSFWKLLKENIINRFEGLMELIPKLGEAISLLFKGEFSEAGKVAGDAVMKVTTGVEDFTDKAVKGFQMAKEAALEFAEEIKTDTNAAIDLANRENELRTKTRENLVTEAKLRAQISEIRAKAADKDNVDAETRLALLDEAIRKENQILTNNQELASERLKLKEIENSLSESTIEDLEAQAQLEKELIDLQTTNANARRRLESERQTAINEIRSDQQAAINEFNEYLDTLDEEDLSRVEAELERSAQQVEAAVEAATAKADAEIERIEKVKEAEEEAAERQKEIDQARAASFAGTINQLTQATADYINGEEDAFAKLAKTIASSLIDNIQATLIAKNAEILIQSMSTPDSILSFGASGALRAASIIALTTAAGAAAKTALGSFGDGGQVPLMANGGSIKSGTFNGNSHSNGGIDLFTGSGKHVANVEGRENFYVVNKNASDMINSLSSINQATGGVSLSKSSKFMAKGGQADMSTSNNDNDNNITAKIVASVMKQMPTQRVMVEDISTGIDDRDAVKDVAVVS